MDFFSFFTKRNSDEDAVPLPTDPKQLAARIAQATLVLPEQAADLSEKVLAGKSILPGEKASLLRINLRSVFHQLVSPRDPQYILVAQKQYLRKFLIQEMMEMCYVPSRREKVTARLAARTSPDRFPLTQTTIFPVLAQRAACVIDFFHYVGFPCSILDIQETASLDLQKVKQYHQRQPQLSSIFSEPVPAGGLELVMWFGFKLEALFDINSLVTEGDGEYKIVKVSPWIGYLHDIADGQVPILLHTPLECEPEIAPVLRAKEKQDKLRQWYLDH